MFKRTKAGYRISRGADLGRKRSFEDGRQAAAARANRKWETGVSAQPSR